PSGPPPPGVPPPGRSGGTAGPVPASNAGSAWVSDHRGYASRLADTDEPSPRGPDGGDSGRGGTAPPPSRPVPDWAPWWSASFMLVVLPAGRPGRPVSVLVAAGSGCAPILPAPPVRLEHVLWMKPE